MRASHLLRAISVLALASAVATASTPALARIFPRGGQLGEELDVTFSGDRLKDVQGLFLYKPGLEALKIEALDDKTVKVRLKIAADAPLGEHPIRLRTSTGISELRTFNVGPFAATQEKEPNNDFKAPQRIELNTTVAGVVAQEDVDHFVVTAKKGQRLTAEVEGMRLGTSLFDSYVAILNMKRFELDASDDTALFLQDSVASIVVPEDGDYVIRIRESSYGGSGDSHYRLHIGTFPRPQAVYPAGGKAGEEVEVTFLGDVQGPLKQKFTLGVPTEKFAAVAKDDGGSSPSPNWMRVSDFPNVLEAEPNDTRDKATATELPLPLAFNGIIGTKGDEDYFRFKGKKGQVFQVRCHARSVRSPLDPVLTVLAAGGAALGSNDDQGGPDSQLRVTLPNDGDYEVHVRDHLKGGGPAHVYRVEFTPVAPNLYTHIPAYDREPRDDTRQWIVVPKGNRFATWIRVNRTDVSGDATLAFENLPPGVTAHCEPILAGVDRVPVVFEATPDAAIAGTLADVVAATKDVKGGFLQQVNLIYGPPNNTVFFGTAVRKLAVAVAEEAPFKLSIVEPKVPLVRAGAMNLKVKAERKPGFDKPITLKLLWSPPGVSAAGEIVMAGNEADYPLNADGNADPRTWKIAVIGSADAGHGAIWTSTQLAPLRVETPYLGMTIDLTAVEQGKDGEVTCKLSVLKPWEGKAKVLLHGLPPQVTAAVLEKEITKDDKEVEFVIKAGDMSPAGQHKTLFCQVLVPEAGDTIAHSVAGGSVIRIDPPATAAAPGAKPAEKKPDDKPAKKLSRLEQLRLEAESKTREGK
ncbi:MAG TPA: pre-peptidase C-terminal domain-containing protein [Planctomycetota bacterium]